MISSYPIEIMSKSSSTRTSSEIELEFRSMMLMISDPIVTSSGFVSITFTSTCSTQAVGADVTGASVGSMLSQIGSQGS